MIEAIYFIILIKYLNGIFIHYIITNKYTFNIENTKHKRCPTISQMYGTPQILRKKNIFGQKYE